MESTTELIDFILAAKKAAYAGDGSHSPPSRLASVDLPFQQGDYSYLDSYLGGYAFVGEEVVWFQGKPVWGMNYYGTMTVPETPTGFNTFLKEALRHVPVEAPYRGPHQFQEGKFIYNCRWKGSLTFFEGEEIIFREKKPIYRLYFHGGSIQ